MRVVFIILICSVALVDSVGQKLMRVAERLQLNAVPLPATPSNSVGSVRKYSFGDYAIVKGKAGWMKTKTKGKGGLLSYSEKSESTQNLSYVFVGKSDTAYVNMVIKQGSVSSSFGSIEVESNSHQSFFAECNLPADSIPWEFTFISIDEPGLGNVDVVNEAVHADQTITLKPVFKWADGSKPINRSVLGYEFLQNGEAIGAVQSSLNLLHKKYVWIDSSLTEQMKLVLATLSATMLVVGDIKGY